MDGVNELLQHVENTRGLSTQLKRLRTFHNANLGLLDFLVNELYAVREAGWNAVSVVSLWEYSRWAIRKTKVPTETFAMNNNFRAYYARIIAILHPQLNGFFEMRESNKPSRKDKGADVELGTKLASEVNGGDYARRLLWADGKSIEGGWRPTTQHEPKAVPRRERVRRKPPVSVGLEESKAERHGS